MNPPSGTTWRNWVALCPYCSEGIIVSTGLEFERAVERHVCPPPCPFPDSPDAA